MAKRVRVSTTKKRVNNATGNSERLKAKSTLAAVKQEEADVSELRQKFQGLAFLPYDLYLEILSYFPAPPLSLANDTQFDADLHAARREALLALSQTCRMMRRFYYPYIWKRIEVCTGMRVGSEVLFGGTKSKDKKLYSELMRQLQLVTNRDPTLAKYVDTINVDIRSYSAFSALQKLAYCMYLFENLHSVRLRIWTGAVTVIKVSEAFKPYFYAFIRLAIISSEAHSLLRLCPQLRSLKCLDQETETVQLILDSTVDYCPLLESFPPITRDSDLQEVAEYIPRLRDLSLVMNYYFPSHEDYHFLETISKLTCLQTITFHITLPLEFIDPVKTAYQFLRHLQKRDKEEKYIRLSITDPDELSPRVSTIRIEVPPLLGVGN